MMRNRDMDSVSESTRNICRICERVLSNCFVPSDQEILRVYFTSRWGDDLYTVEDYSARTGIPVSTIWMVVKRASRAVMEEMALIERRGDGSA